MLTCEPAFLNKPTFELRLGKIAKEIKGGTHIHFLAIRAEEDGIHSDSIIMVGSLMSGGIGNIGLHVCSLDQIPEFELGRDRSVAVFDGNPVAWVKLIQIFLGSDELVGYGPLKEAGRAFWVNT